MSNPFEKPQSRQFTNEDEKIEGEVMISPEKETEIKEKWHTLEGVKDYLDERADVYIHLNKNQYTEDGIKMGLEMSKNFSNLNKELERENFEDVLRSVETSLGEGLHWNNNENRSRFIGAGEKTEFIRQRYGFNLPSDIDRLPENKIMQERMRTMADILTEKLYEKRGRALKPANYEEIADYLGREIKSWEMDNDSYVILLKEAVQKKDHSVLVDQIDTSLGVEISNLEQINTGNKELKDIVERKYHTGNARASLLSQIENLRRYRKFLYEKLSERGIQNDKVETAKYDEKLEGEKLFKQQIENNSRPDAKDIKEQAVLFLDDLDKYASKDELDFYKTGIGEILFRREIEYDPNKKPEFSEKDKAVLESLWKFRQELDRWDTFTEPRIRDYRKRIFEYLRSTFGIDENRPNEGEKLNSKEHKTSKVEETNNKFLDYLIKKVIRPGFKINDKLYEYHRNNFLAEDKIRQEEFRKLKDELPREEFDKRYAEYLKWKKQHEFTRTIRPADVVIYKYKPESK